MSQIIEHIVLVKKIIEHIVLVKIKDNTDPSKINSMINALHALKSLDGVLHLTAGPIHTIRSPSSNFSHMLHGRYKSKNKLQNYSLHPEHLSIVKEIFNPIGDDMMVLNWVADLLGPIVPRVGEVMRVSFLKLQEELEQSGKGEVLKIDGEIKYHFGSIVQITFGENFSPAKAKGFSIASLVIFPGLSEKEAFDLKEKLVKEQNEKVRGLLESIIIVNYVIHPPQSASLSKCFSPRL